MTIKQWLYRNFYLHTPYWRWLRKKVGKRASWFCQVRGCGVSGHNLDCHHTTYAIIWLEWLFIWKMVYLCRKHHTDTHSGRALILHGGKTLKPFRRIR